MHEFAVHTPGYPVVGIDHLYGHWWRRLRRGDVGAVCLQRRLIAGALTAVLGALGLILAPSEASFLWRGMLDHALVLVIVTILIGVGAAAALWYRRYQWARILIIGEAAFLLGSWGVSQLPYLIPPDVTVTGAASSQNTMLTLLVGLIIALIIVVPSFWLLFYVFKFKKGTEPAAAD